MLHRITLAGLAAAILSVASAVCAAPGAPGKPVVVDGTLEVEVADYPDRTSSLHHFLRTPDGRRHVLKLKDKQAAHHLVTGTKVRVKGNLADNVLEAEASPVVVSTETATATPMAAAMPYASGVQNTAVILVNFQDKITSPQTPSAVQSLVFGSVNNFYLENSFQTTSISGNVFGWYTIPVSSTTCNTSAIKTYARSAATAAGVDLSPYSRFVYIFPNTSACSWAGYGIIGGSPTDAWINGYFDRRVIAHELGHNLGLYHAHGLNCNATPIGSTCTTSEYGDLIDTMGWGLYGHFSAYQKEVLGWLNFGGMPPITTVQSSGTYALAPYAASTGTGTAKALKILKGSNPTTGEKTYYYLEYRQPSGFDSSLSGVGNLTTGVSFHAATASTGALLLDMTPNSDTTSYYNDDKDSTLAVGKTYSDPAAGVSFTVTRADTTGALVYVELAAGSGTATCTRAKPSVSISPTQSSAVAAGTTYIYTVAVTNNDSAACGTSSFPLTKSLPPGWAGSLSSTSLSIGAGSAASTTFSVTSPATTAAGSYSLGITATNSVSTLAGSAAATYSVASPSGLTESVTMSKPSYVFGDTFTATATVLSNGTVVPGASVTFTVTKPNGATLTSTGLTGSSGRLAYWHWLDKLNDPAGLYKVVAVVTSNGKTATATTSFTVQ